MRALPLLCLLAAPAAAEDLFHGWSRDGTWLAYESRGENELVELHFCPTDAAVKPSWPGELDALERGEGPLACVTFLDPNKAPYQWRAKLSLPAASPSLGKLRVASELVHDGEGPGFAVEAGDQRQLCAASGVREDSRLQKVWWHPSGRWLAALIDGQLHHCAVQLKAAAGPKRPPGKRR